MLNVGRAQIDQILGAQSPAGLYEFLQLAIELEHATIPPYLTALRSIDKETNPAVFNALHSVVVEEMLHMTICANLLNAIGGIPSVNYPKFIPEYPGRLPLGVGDDLVVSLRPFSKNVVKDVFMEIEEPESHFDSKGLVEGEHLDSHATIGQFYHAIETKLEQFGPAAFIGDSRRQVVLKDYSGDELFAVTDLDSARAAMQVIVEQGEGSRHSPYEPDRELAHYYKLGEIYHGRRLIPDPDEPGRYAYEGDVVEVDEAAVRNLTINQRLDDLPRGSDQRRLAFEFSVEYSYLLDGLHECYNGYANLQPSVDRMFRLKAIGERLVEMDNPSNSGFKVGLVFKYLHHAQRQAADNA